MSDGKVPLGPERLAGGRLDDAIDRAVRRMMSADPPAGLRRRVLDRLDTAETTWGWASTFAYAGAALALMVVVTVVLRQTGPDPQTTSPPVARTAPAPVTPPAAEDRATRPATQDEPGSRARRIPTPDPVARRVPDRRISAASLPEDDVPAAVPSAGEAAPPPDQDALAAVPPIKSPMPIHIAPLVIEPLRIDPIPPPK